MTRSGVRSREAQCSAQANELLTKPTTDTLTRTTTLPNTKKTMRYQTKERIMSEILYLFTESHQDFGVVLAHDSDRLTAFVLRLLIQIRCFKVRLVGFFWCNIDHATESIHPRDLRVLLFTIHHGGQKSPERYAN